jgi:hypothetical protein
LLEPADTDIDGRAYKALGDGFSNSYKPLKTGAQLLILNNDLTFDANIGMVSLSLLLNLPALTH